MNYITRDEAAKRLNVSKRTLDRYIRKMRIKTKRDGKNILILWEDMMVLFKDRNIEQEIIVGGVGGNEVRSKAITTTEAGMIYQKYIEDIKKQLEKKEEKIEMLNYKLGQMDARLKQSIPMLEQKRITDDMSIKMGEQARLLDLYGKKIRAMRMVKNIYVAILMLLVLGLPFLWFFMVK